MNHLALGEKITTIFFNNGNVCHGVVCRLVGQTKNMNDFEFEFRFCVIGVEYFVEPGNPTAIRRVLDEDVTWCRGWHPAESSAVRALFVAKALS